MGQAKRVGKLPNN